MNSNSPRAKASVKDTTGNNSSSPEQERFLRYGEIYASNTPEPPPLPEPTMGADGKPVTNGARAIRTATTRQSVHGDSRHSKSAMQQKNNQGK